MTRTSRPIDLRARLRLAVPGLAAALALTASRGVAADIEQTRADIQAGLDSIGFDPQAQG